MNAADLLAKVRARLDDKVDGGNSLFLWSDEEIIDDYAGPALEQMFLTCRSLLTDSTTATDAEMLPLCRLPLRAGEARYVISPKILRVVRLKLASQQQPLRMVSAADLDELCPGWDNEPAGTPWGYCLDLDTDCVTFIPAPASDDSARLTVYRFPLAPISLDSDDDLGFRDEYQDDLISGILSLAFSKKDSGTDRPDLAAMEEKRFANRLEDIKLELLRRSATPHTNRVRRAFSTR
jgi:hypothetical protein